VSLQRFTDAVRKAIAAENYYAALALALTLPDMCVKLTTGRTSGAKYAAWIEKYMPGDYWRLGAQGFEAAFKLLNYTPPKFVPEDFYALRCAYLHEGSGDITEQAIQHAINRFQFL